jgi:hypothetical protein
MKIKFVRSLVVGSLVLGLSACASILNEETQSVNIMTSNGQKIEGTIDGVPFTGPGIVSVKRADADKIINVSTEGCTEQTVANKEVDSAFWVNILSGGAFGSTTDYSTDKMWRYDDTIHISCHDK